MEAPAPIRPLAVPDITLESEDGAAANRRRALTITIVPPAVLGVVIIGVLAAVGAVVVGVIVGVVVAAAAATALWRGALGVVLRSLGARLVDEDDVPGVANQVDGLCATMGLALPDLYMVDDPRPDALALGRTRGSTAIVFTRGLLQAIDPVALEGVLAHELTHIKRDDVAPATTAAALAVLVPVLPSASFVHRVAGRGREFSADAEAVRVTRFPPGLRQALAEMATERPSGHVRHRRAARVTRWLWTVPLPGPDGRCEPADATGELDAPGVRMAALDEW